MKTVLVVRHAKSSWSDLTLADHRRPLNGRGKRDAPYMASIAQQKEQYIDLLISSPAKRAFRTAKYFRKAFGLSKEYLWEDKRLYLASPEEMIEVIQETPDEYQNIAIFSHNPGTTQLANLLGDETIVNVPTTGVFKVVSEAAGWSSFQPGNTKLVDFYYPKLMGL
ncbi:MAG: histidine phosphatase family protein [Saprospiraceae bacterium]|nr:histidine phosphatase family protein [Saprospiraceae bacterium]